MKVPMDLRQPARSQAQAPSPAIASLFNRPQQILGDEAEWDGIAIGQPHDAFTMADKFPQSTAVQVRLSSFGPMDRHKIVHKGLAAFLVT